MDRGTVSRKLFSGNLLFVLFIWLSVYRNKDPVHLYGSSGHLEMFLSFTRAYAWDAVITLVRPEGMGIRLQRRGAG